ncbi:uncharacterized protein METZ01_LOCUS319721, partial [marine metagenome]
LSSCSVRKCLGVSWRSARVDRIAREERNTCGSSSCWHSGTLKERTP